MDNLKTGNLIREARKSKTMTQLELAQRLHVTDRAVSKWERGVCAPDIALLEPLGEALGLSVTELISGERDSLPDAETAVRDTISYSRAEIRQRTKAARRKIAAFAIAAAILAAAVCLGIMWYKGVFYIIGRYPSPDSSTLTTVYSRDMSYSGPPEEGGFTLKDTGHYRGMVGYLNAEFKGLWWSPDGKKQVVSMTPVGEGWEGFGDTVLSLSDYERNKGCNLDLYLERSIYGERFFEGVPWDGDNIPRRCIEFEFVQWSGADPDKMLIYFSYFDAEMDFREGYMWYDYESGEISGEMEIERGEKETDFIHKMWDEVME